MKKINCVILDWAGTTVDYGSFAPVDAFITAFKSVGLSPTLEETREPMGLAKKTHIELMMKGERLSAMWKEISGREYSMEDIEDIYRNFESALFKGLSIFTDPLPGVLDTVDKLRSMGMSIGSTTGYTKAMMDVVVPEAKKKGYSPDCMICPDDTGGTGRPAPYMLWQNVEKLGIPSINEVIKVGDTAADMQEGRNAGCLSVGVIKGSSMLGLSEGELLKHSDSKREKLFSQVKRKYKKAGADYVIEDITVLPELIKSIK